MMVIRPVATADLTAIGDLARECGVGMTTLPDDEQILKQRIESSVNAISTELTSPGSEYYLFVLEDTEQNKIVGCSAIKAAAGLTYPLYSYKLVTVTRVSTSLNIRKDHQLLHLVNDLQGTTEICTLYLSPTYRKAGNGTLLSQSRFLFMAQQPQRFTDTVFAEMRGISDQQGKSAFWDSLCRHFFDMDFAQADYLTAITNKQFIADLMPREPIYVCLLSKEAQAVIGKPHKSTKPAMKILQQQGFSYQNYVDIFDAGPTVNISRQQIKAIKKAQSLIVKDIKAFKAPPTSCLIATSKKDFRVSLVDIEFNTSDEVIISPTVAEQLQIEKNDPIMISPL